MKFQVMPKQDTGLSKNHLQFSLIEETGKMVKMLYSSKLTLLFYQTASTVGYTEKDS